MRRTIGWAALLAAVGVVGGGTPGRAGDGSEGRHSAGSRSCSEATLRGKYGIRMEGTRPAGPPPAPGLPPPMESVVGVVLRTYDGRGGFEQLDNIKGSVTGIVPLRAGSGTYEVSADCTGLTRFNPGTGVVIQERLVIVDHGREVFSIVESPAPVMVATVQKKVH